MASSDRGIKKKRVNLNVAQKLELIEKLEQGVSVAHICEIYGIKKQTVSDIRKSKTKLQQFCLKYNLDSSKWGSTVGTRKHMKVAQDKNLEEDVYKWFVQQRSSGVNVQRLQLKSACETLGEHMGLNVKESDGWLWQFRKMNGIVNEETNGESVNVDTAQVEPFKKFINELTKSTGNQETTEDDVQQWHENDDNPDYKVFSKEEFVGNDLQDKTGEEKQVTLAQPSLHEMRNLMDIAIHYIGTSSDPEIVPYYEHFEQFKAILVKKQLKRTSSPTPILSQTGCISQASTSKQKIPMPPSVHHSKFKSEAEDSPLPELASETE